MELTQSQIDFLARRCFAAHQTSLVHQSDYRYKPMAFDEMTPEFQSAFRVAAKEVFLLAKEMLLKEDLSVLEAMLQRAGIDYHRDGVYPSETQITVERGYSGFVTSFQFCDDGRLRDMGAYE